MSELTTWTVEHFSQANPAGKDQGDVPALLRRVADSVDALGESLRITAYPAPEVSRQ